ncbi:MAG: SLOG family protein [Ruminococcus sp.]|nr:SLOG family protein [Ruminococcus sp.]MDE7225418.1 SLOG family protein [Ruminococcus sp.]
MKSACFTGHRNLPRNLSKIELLLYSTLEKAVTEKGIVKFYAGGAVGWDTLAELTVLKLKKIYPHVQLNLVLPCSGEEQTKKWSAEQKKIFYDILERADSIEYTSPYYFKGCMKKRNKKLVEYADICYCFYNPSLFRSGTAQTVHMAKKKEIPLINFFIK